MRKTQLATKMAKQSGVTRAEAADQLDRVVHDIITNLRKGKPASLPGLGQFQPGDIWKFQFNQSGRKGPDDQR